MAISDKLTYLNDTKGLIKDSINLGGGNLTTEPFRQYATTLKNIYKDFFANGIETLWNNWEKVTGTGTSLSLSPTIQGEMEFTYKGNTSQNGTPTPSSPIPINVVSGDNTINICGKNLFGFNLSAIDKTSTYRTTPTQQLIITGTDNPNEVKFNYNNGPYSRGYFEINGIDGTLNYNISFNVKEKTSSYKPVATIDTSNSTSEKLVFYISGNNGGTNVSSDNYFILNNIQVEKGTTQTTFEPYIGHSYPIYLGVENLFNGVIGVANARVSTGTGGTYTSSGSSVSDYLEVEPITDYYLETGRQAYFCWYDSTKTKISGDVWNNEVSKTSPSNASFIRFDFATDNKDNVIFEKGTTKQHTSTQPIELCKIGTYQDYIYKGVGYNLFDKDNVRVGYRFGSDGDYYQNAGYNATEYISVKPNTTYSTSWTMVWDEVVCTYDANHTFIRRIQAGTNFTTSASEYYIRADVSNAHLPIAQINEGSTALPYEPYNAKDKWLLHKEIGKDKLSSSNVVYHGVDNYRYQFEFTPSQTSIAKASLYSTHFYNNSSTQWWTIDNNIYLNGASVVYITSTQYTSITAFNNFTSTNGVYVYYPLATPTAYEITDTTLINQLEENKLSYISQTNISQVNNDLPFNLVVKALKNI